MADIEAMLKSLQALHPRVIDLSLGRIENLLERLGRPQDRLPPVIHVAGTNGKGSTIAFLRAILEAAGHSVHVYTSPHLVRFNERIRLGAPGAGQLVDDNALAQAIGHIQTVNDGEAVTYFEATTAVALHLFAENPADFCLLEVGLGGRFDATNVIDAPLAAVISTVSHDHAEFLGEDLTGIAAEKAGILKSGRPGIIGPQDEFAMAMIALEAGAAGAELFKYGEEWMASGERGRLVYEDEDGLLDLPLPKLFGDHQIANAGLAVATLRAAEIDIGKPALDAGIVQARWPARLQRLTSGPLVERLPADSEVWLDGGHNPAAGLALSAVMGQLEERMPRPLVLIAGMLSTKDPEGFFRPFEGLARYILTVPVAASGAGIDPSVLADIAMACDLPARPLESVGEAFDAVNEIFEGDEAPRVLVCGSLYLAGDILNENGPLPD
jgi:dihydrofolate synthase/folylpolyglutamate synthase